MTALGLGLDITLPRWRDGGKSGVLFGTADGRGIASGQLTATPSVQLAGAAFGVGSARTAMLSIVAAAMLFGTAGGQGQANAALTVQAGSDNAFQGQASGFGAGSGAITPVTASPVLLAGMSSGAGSSTSSLFIQSPAASNMVGRGDGLASVSGAALTVAAGGGTAPTISMTNGDWFAGSTYTVANGGTGNWQINGTDVAGATSSTFVKRFADEGRALRWMRSDGVASAPIELWVPTDYPNARFWWDARDTANIVLVGSKVGSWADRIGGLAATQGTDSARPGYNATARNGKPALSFSSGQDMSFNPAGLPDADVTVMAVAFFDLATTSGDWRRVFCYGEPFDNNKGIQLIRQGSSKTACEITTSPGNVDWAQADRVVMLSKSGTVGSLYVDGSDVLKTATFATTLATTTGYIGRGLQFADRWSGSVQQLFGAASAGSVSDRRSLQGWASWSQGMKGANLPADHPYKNAPPRIS